MMFSFSSAIDAAVETARATAIPCAVIDRRGEVLYPVKRRDYPCRMCRVATGMASARRDIAENHAERAFQAERIGVAQIFLCPSNLMHWIAPVRDATGVRGALVGGPVRLAEGDTGFQSDILEPLRHTSQVVASAQESGLRELYERIPIVGAARVQALASSLSRVARDVSATATEERGSDRLQRESRINEYIQELKRYRHDEGMQADIPTYPLEREQALLEAIGSGDDDRAQAILNELLSHVFFRLGADLERIKVRAREIVILLSRIVIARGADENRVFGYNYRALDEVDGLEDINDVAHWMARIVRGFASTVLRVPASAEHTTLLRRVIAYVDEAYRGRVSLRAAAALGGVSTGYLSRVFSREMGETFSRYVRRVRVQRAQELLSGTTLAISDVADLCGFADQSHLTLAFRKETGETPALFRKRL